MELQPPFLSRLADPAIKTVLVAGCGGGFDFVHGLLLHPFLERLGKRVVRCSYSFGDPHKIRGEAPIVFRQGEVIAKRVSGANTGRDFYCPEVHLCSFLDAEDPDHAPHAIYACYARDFTVPVLRALYAQLVEEHAVDAVVLIDGGSDSLMRGDEEGLGDPIEDCVSVTAVSSLDGPRERLLVAVGLGCDRFNQVSDAASLRAIAELTASGGFLGATAVHAGDASFELYRAGVDYLDARQGFRSVIAGSIISAGEGHFGTRSPPRLRSRVEDGQAFAWPLMSMLWGFDVNKVVERSLIAGWIREQTTVAGCYQALDRGRAALQGSLRGVEELPLHDALRGPTNPWRP